MKKPIHESEVHWDLWYEGTDREIKGKALSDVGGKAKVGFGIMELAIGANTLPSHYHSHEEEHLYVLNGTANLYLGKNAYLLNTGSYICFPAGQEQFHHLENTGNVLFRYIIVGERLSQDRVTHEPKA